MCGRYALTNIPGLQQRFKIEDGALTLNPRYNVAPTQAMPVVLRDKENANRLETLKWGLIPFWSKEPKAGYSTINARAEGIVDKPAYRKPVRNQRCIVPADGFFEWQKTGAGKIPHFIHLKDGELFGFAGLYDTYRTDDGLVIKTYTIITTEANEVVAPIHNRMPVILRPEDEDEWLDITITDPYQVTRFLKPYPAHLMEAYPVSREVNSPSRDVPELVRTLNSA